MSKLFSQDYTILIIGHGGKITGGALTLHQVHSVGACVSYVWQSLSDIPSSYWWAIKAAANELTCNKLPRLNLLRVNPVSTLLAGIKAAANELTCNKLPQLNLVVVQKVNGREDLLGNFSIRRIYIYGDTGWRLFS